MKIDTQIENNCRRAISHLQVYSYPKLQLQETDQSETYGEYISQNKKNNFMLNSGQDWIPSIYQSYCVFSLLFSQKIPTKHDITATEISHQFSALKVPVLRRNNREFKIRRLRTTATDKYVTAHDQNHVTVHFSRVVLRLRWIVELFRVVGTTENILLVFCRLRNSRISSFRKNVFNSPALSEREAKCVSCV